MAAERKATYQARPKGRKATFQTRPKGRKATYRATGRASSGRRRSAGSAAGGAAGVPILLLVQALRALVALLAPKGG